MKKNRKEKVDKVSFLKLLSFVAGRIEKGYNFVAILIQWEGNFKKS